ncbi:MAG: glycosyltransferase family 2 protein [bacterium]|jgi:glycosyltransferase involved in cell wall biosynthesis|nr:glycosyltransferase family 2 protein [bacterium]
MKISVIVPCYNEGDSIARLVSSVHAALSSVDYELILIDDGSQDHSPREIARAAEGDSRVRGIYFRRNYGQTAAMSAGFDDATGDILVPLDADLQNDPEDILKLVEKITEGFDVVSGWRKDRLDHWSRVWPSQLANGLVRWITGVKLHDFGCSLKAYRRHVLDQVHLYGEMHRFIPVYAHWNGARITEMPVRHHPRTSGTSKYGFGRIPKVLLDLLVLKLLGSYATKPIHMFGFMGGILILLGGTCISVTAYNRLFDHIFIKDQPLFLVGIFLWLVAVQTIMLGLVAELVIRVYHEARGAKPYLRKPPDEV